VETREKSLEVKELMVTDFKGKVAALEKNVMALEAEKKLKDDEIKALKSTMEKEITERDIVIQKEREWQEE